MDTLHGWMDTPWEQASLNLGYGEHPRDVILVLPNITKYSLNNSQTDFSGKLK